MKENFVIKKTTIEGIKEYLKHRWRLKLSARDICMLTVIRPLFHRCLSQKKKDSFGLRKERLYHSGYERIHKDLDCVNLLFKLR